MSVVIEMMKEKATRLGPNIGDELESKGLSRLLRRETWSDHERAEHSPFEVALIKVTITREAYLELLLQVHPVYCALEDRAEELKADPIAGSVIVPELNRRENLEADIRFYGGDVPVDPSRLLGVTKEYVDRIRTVSPLRYVAHHYNRYLADLSGGLMIRDALRSAWGLDGEGLRYYDFPGISNADDFKNAYRGTLDELPLEAEQKLELIEEVMIAYEFNIQMVRELGDLYLPAQA